MKLDIDEFIKIKQALTSHDAGEVVPLSHKNSDSFATLTGGAVKNWPLIAFVITAAFFVNNAITDGKAVDQSQNSQIAANAKAIEVLTQSVNQLAQSQQTLNTTQLNSYNELIRKIDAITIAVDNLKAKP